MKAPHAARDQAADLQIMLTAIARTAARLCAANHAVIYLIDGERYRLVADCGRRLRGRAIGDSFPVHERTPITQAFRERRTIHVRDLAAAAQRRFPDILALQRSDQVRTVLVAPLLRAGIAIGGIVIRRTRVQPFTATQIALLKTFAAQAVIAIENMRLSNETKAAVEQQAATSEILRIISSSPTDVQPVFDAIAASASRLCGGVAAIVTRLDGEMIHLVAHHNPRPGIVPVTARLYPRRPSRDTTTGRAILDRKIVHIPDAEKDPELAPNLARDLNARTFVAVPILHDGEPIGAISVSSEGKDAFAAGQIELLKIFADQAVIAIENVRLFKELETKNRELTTALDRQTATSEILRVISRSPTDAQPVFDTLLRNAVQLCNAVNASLYRFDGQLIHLVANHNLPPALLGSWQRMFPRPPGWPLRVVLTSGAMLRIDDVSSGETAWSEAARDALRIMDAHSALFVPVRRQGQSIGAIALFHRDIAAFTDQHVALLQTFADQAVIAIENARLFQELEASNREIAEKSRQIEVASQHKSEFLANMSHELRTPLNAIIGFSEVLTERMFGELNEKQEEYLKDIYASGTHLLSLINDILDLSKIEAGRMELELTEFHLPTALDSALTLVRERAGRRSIALQMNIDSRLGQIQADERKVRQVVLNLLSNAIKFTPEGGCIEVAATSKDRLIEVSVSDTGVGIAPEDQEAVFAEFRQVGTADKKAEGTGLGLTLCRKFIELHGGRIWVKSREGVGSTFTFTIPVHPEK